MVKSFTDLEVWQLAVELTVNIYQLTKSFPREEQHGMTAQIRRSSGSVGANIAEGFGRYHYRDFNKFLYTSRGSLQETKHWLILSEQLGYLDKNTIGEAISKIEKLNIKLNNLIRSTVARANNT